MLFIFFFQAEDGIRDFHVTGVQTCALPILVDGELREVPPEGFHACHYCGWTTDLPGRVRDHLAGVYVRGGKQRGRGARLVAAAIAAGATVELIRAWRAPREFEQLLK